MTNGWDDLSKEERVALVLRAKWANEERVAGSNPPPPREHPNSPSDCLHVWSNWAWNEDQRSRPHEDLPMQRDCPLCGAIDERAVTVAEADMRRRIVEDAESA